MKKKLIIIASVLIVVVVAAALIGWLFFNHYLGKIDRIDHDNIQVIAPEDEDFEVDEPEPEPQPEPEPAPAPDPQPEPEPDPEPEPEPTDQDLADAIQWGDIEALNDDELINILLVGQDARDPNERARSDTMILCSLNPETNQVNLISFMRDLYVQYPEGYSDNRLNAAYRFGGMPLLYQTLELNFGITVDAGVEVNFSGFEEIVNLVGGVDLYMNAAEANAMNIMDATTEKSEGVNHCDGRDALKFSRLRHIDNDFNRTNRQRYVLIELFTKIKNSDLSTLLSLVEGALPYIRTDMSNQDILNLVTKVAPILPKLQIGTYRVPGEGAYTNQRIRGMAVLVPNLPMIQDSLRNEYLPLSK